MGTNNIEKIKFEQKSNSHYLISQNTGDVFYVIFSGTTKKNGKFDFWKVAHELKGTVLLLNDGKCNWYQNGVEGLGGDLESTLDTIRRMVAYFGSSKIVTVGLSMGGYGAALFASLLGGDCLAFGLDTKLRAEGSRSAQRMPRSTKLIYPDLIKVIKHSSSRFCFYTGDLDYSDLYSITRIAHLKNVDSRYLSGVSHGVAPFIKESYGLTKLIDEFSSNNQPYEFLNESSFWKTARGVEASKNLNIANNYFKKGQLEEAKFYASSALSLSNNSVSAKYLMGLILKEQEDFQAAYEVFSSVVGILPNLAGARVHIVRCALKLAEYNVALANCKELLRIKPDSGFASYWIGRLLVNNGELESGICYLKDAVNSSPENSHFARFLTNNLKVESEISKLLGDDEFSPRSPLSNNGGGTFNKILWIKPWVGFEAAIQDLKKVYISSVNTLSKFKNKKTSINTGFQRVVKASFDEKKGLVRIDLLIEEACLSNNVIAESSVRFYLCVNSVVLSEVQDD